MFAAISQKIKLAHLKLNEVNQSTATLALDTGDITEKLNDLSHKAQEQNDFYRNHFRLTGQK